MSEVITATETTTEVTANWTKSDTGTKTKKGETVYTYAAIINGYLCQLDFTPSRRWKLTVNGEKVGADKGLAAKMDEADNHCMRAVPFTVPTEIPAEEIADYRADMAAGADQPKAATVVVDQPMTDAEWVASVNADADAGRVEVAKETATVEVAAITRAEPEVFDLVSKDEVITPVAEPVAAVVPAPAPKAPKTPKAKAEPVVLADGEPDWNAEMGRIFGEIKAGRYKRNCWSGFRDAVWARYSEVSNTVCAVSVSERAALVDALKPGDKQLLSGVTYDSVNKWWTATVTAAGRKLISERKAAAATVEAEAAA